MKEYYFTFEKLVIDLFVQGKETMDVLEDSYIYMNFDVFVKTPLRHNVEQILVTRHVVRKKSRKSIE